MYTFSSTLYPLWDEPLCSKNMTDLAADCKWLTDMTDLTLCALYPLSTDPHCWRRHTGQHSRPRPMDRVCTLLQSNSFKKSTKCIFSSLQCIYIHTLLHFTCCLNYYRLGSLECSIMQKLASTCKYCAVLFCVGTECQYGSIYFTRVSKIALKVRAKQKTQILHQSGDKLHVCTCLSVLSL